MMVVQGQKGAKTFKKRSIYKAVRIEVRIKSK